MVVVVGLGPAQHARSSTKQEAARAKYAAAAGVELPRQQTTGTRLQQQQQQRGEEKEEGGKIVESRLLRRPSFLGLREEEEEEEKARTLLLLLLLPLPLPRLRLRDPRRSGRARCALSTTRAVPRAARYATQRGPREEEEEEGQEEGVQSSSGSPASESSRRRQEADPFSATSAGR